MYDTTKTKITTEMVPRNCEPKPTSVFVNGTAKSEVGVIAYGIRD